MQIIKTTICHQEKELIMLVLIILYNRIKQQHYFQYIDWTKTVMLFYISYVGRASVRCEANLCVYISRVPVTSLFTKQQLLPVISKFDQLTKHPTNK